MDTEMMIELFGYLGSVLVVCSMLMSSVVKLRVINTIGSVISGTYALIIGSFPLALMNICLVAINVYNLRKLLVTKQHYDLIDGKADDAFLNYFLEHYKEDIKIYFPNFQRNENSFDVAQVICCNANPAGVLLGSATENGEIKIALEYTSPTYRDCSVGKFLYSELPKLGIKKLIFAGESPKHTPYLQKMGYTSTKDGYVRVL